jgi:hypothetical protein
VTLPAELQEIVDKNPGRRRQCQLCCKRLPKAARVNTVWCHRCVATHSLAGACSACNGEYHFPVSEDETVQHFEQGSGVVIDWRGFGNVVGECVNALLFDTVLDYEQGTLQPC